MVNNTVFTDVLVIGQGLAGLRAAAEASARGMKVTVLGSSVCASVEIMGMNAVMAQPDSIERYWKDIVESGRFIGRDELAYILAEHSTEAANDLTVRGLAFESRPDGGLETACTLGSSMPRLIHVKSHTGVWAMDVYRAECVGRGVQFHSDIQALELLVRDGTVCGAVGVNGRANRLTLYAAGAVVLASNGASGTHLHWRRYH